MTARQVIKAVLIDLSGTLHIESLAVNGAVDALNKLRATGVGIRFVTNTTKESKRVLYERLKSMGFQLQSSEIFTSLNSARMLVEKLCLRPMLLLEDAALEDFQDVSTNDPNAVVVGLAPNKFDHKTMNSAFRLIIDGAELIAIHKGRYYQRMDGPALGPGPFVAALEYATDKTATVVGKPERDFFLNSLHGLSSRPDETIMIGDDARDDIQGAQRAGLMGILVKTGKYREGDELKYQPPPNYVMDDFPAAVQHIISTFNLVSHS
ncbi:Haloacid dehalogenase-like hydrolase domain-containing protein 2 [Chamberlinius hualienensis]